MQMFGRAVIYTDVSSVTAQNVLDVLSKALTVHAQNQSEIDYLYNYYKGKTPILSKRKQIRPTINYRICKNHASEIVTFKTSYCFSEPIQYVVRGNKKTLIAEIDKLNDFMFARNKAVVDADIGDWMHIAGTAYRMALPAVDDDADESPFEVYTLDPRYTFVVYSSGIGNKPMMGVKIIKKENQSTVYSVYTNDMYFEIVDSLIAKAQPHVLGMIPIIEYPAKHRLGAFEIVLPLLDAINAVESNRLDDVEQYVNSFLALMGGSIDEDTLKKLDEFKMLCLPEGANVKYLSGSLNQADIQVLADGLYQYVLKICGMPSQAGESASTSDTGKAVVYRGGWSQAFSRAKATAAMFQGSERQFLKLILRIMRDTVGTNLFVRDVDVKFTFDLSDNIITKTQALQSLLTCGIAPDIAIATCGLWSDPTDVYMRSKKYLSQWDVTDDEDVSEDGHVHEEAAGDDPQEVREESPDDGDGRA